MNKDLPSKIIGIQFSVLSPDEIRKSSVAEITSRDTYINNKPVIGGLFDPRMGVLEPGIICPTDGLNFMNTPGYFGHIELARPVFYIQYINTILKILRCVCPKCSKLKICKKKHAFVKNMKDGKKKWDYVFKQASKIKRCGNETTDGCGTKQPSKIYKEGLANVFAEWQNTEKIEGVDDKLRIKLTPENILKIFRRISDEDIDFMGFNSLHAVARRNVPQLDQALAAARDQLHAGGQEAHVEHRAGVALERLDALYDFLPMTCYP